MAQRAKFFERLIVGLKSNFSIILSKKLGLKAGLREIFFRFGLVRARHLKLVLGSGSKKLGSFHLYTGGTMLNLEAELVLVGRVPVEAPLVDDQLSVGVDLERLCRHLEEVVGQRRLVRRLKKVEALKVTTSNPSEMMK